jgi:hypothetical protein
MYEKIRAESDLDGLLKEQKTIWTSNTLNQCEIPALCLVCRVSSIDE